MGSLLDLREQLQDMEQWYQHYELARPGAWDKSHFTAATYVISATAELCDAMCKLQQDVIKQKEQAMADCVDAWHASVRDRAGIEG